MFVYKMYPTFRQSFVYILCAKFCCHSSFNFVYKMYTKVCQNVVYILYAFCIHFHTSVVYTLYNFFIQNAYTISVWARVLTSFSTLEIHIDFSENLTLTLTEEIQLMCWGQAKSQVTVHFGILKDAHREKAPSSKTPALTKSRKMSIWLVGTSNQLFSRGS